MKHTHTHHHTSENSSALEAIQKLDQKVTSYQGELRGTMNSYQGELRGTMNSVHDKVNSMTPAPTFGFKYGSPPGALNFSSVDTPQAAKSSGQTNGLLYCTKVLSIQDNNELQNLVDMETEGLREIRIVTTTLESLQERHFLDLRGTDPNTLYVIDTGNNNPTGCIFYEQNEFADDFDSHDETTIRDLARALGFSFSTALIVESKENEEAEILMATQRKNSGHLSSFLAVVCRIIIQPSPQIDCIGFEGPSNEVKYELSLDAEILEELCENVSHINFTSLRLVDTHLEAMGKATDKASKPKTFHFCKCEFLVEGTNSLFVRNTESPMKIQVLEIPNSSFFTDCENAIKSGILTSLVISTDTNPTQLDISDFLSVVNIQRTIIDKDLGELFFRNNDDGPFNVGHLELIQRPNLYIPSKLTSLAVQEAAKINPDNYADERGYRIAVIDAAKSVLTS